jgi:hypothetical protein
MTKEDDHRLKNYNRLLGKFINGYYQTCYWLDSSSNILVFERNIGKVLKKNCINLNELDYDIDVLNRCILMYAVN